MRRRPDDTLTFPFNQRWLMGIWSFLFNPDQRFEPNIAQSAEWNRGAYLAEAMAHYGNATRHAVSSRRSTTDSNSPVMWQRVGVPITLPTPRQRRGRVQ